MSDRRKFNHEQALEMYNQGKAITEISDEFGVAESCVYEAIINLGGKIRKKMSHDQKELAKKMYEDGKTLKDIAMIFEVSVPTISMLLKKLGVKTRNNSKLSSEDVDKMVLMYNSGIGGETISKMFGIHPNHVRRVIKKSQK